MPVLIDAPTGADPTEFDFEFEKLMGVEVSAIEDATGLYYADFMQAFYSGSFKVRHAVAWVLVKRTIPTLTLKQYERTPAEIDVRPNLANARTYVKRYSANPDEDDKAQIAAFFEEFGDAIYRTDEGEDAPKATTSE